MDIKGALDPESTNRPGADGHVVQKDHRATYLKREKNLPQAFVSGCELRAEANGSIGISCLVLQRLNAGELRSVGFEQFLQVGL